jgi:hypothetical protein
MSSSVNISYNKFAPFDNPFSLSQTGPMMAVADFAPEYLSEIGRPGDPAALKMIF